MAPFRYLLQLCPALLMTGAMASPLFAWAEDLPKIPRPQSEPLSSAMKRSMADWDRRMQRDFRECIRDARKADRGAGEFSVRYEVLLDSPALFSLKMHQEYYCGGPYPAYGSSSVVFDTSTGKPYNPLQLYRVADPGTLELRSEVRQMMRHQLLASRAGDAEDPCIPVLQEDPMQSLDYDSVALGANALYIFYSGPHVVQACYEPVVLPYNQLTPFLDQTEAKRLRWHR